MGLSDLDERLVPRLAEALRRALDGAADRRSRARAALRGGWRRLLDPVAGPLRRLDDRYAASGPLQLLRDVPQLALLLVAVVFLTGAGVALARGGAEREQERRELAQDAALPLSLGAPVGADAEEHLAAARERTVALGRDDPDEAFLSLVSVRDELTAEQAGDLLDGSGLQARRVYVRAPVAGEPGELLEVDPGDDVVGTLTALFAETARRKAEEQREFLSLAQSIEPTSEQERAFKQSYEQAARTAAQEAEAYAAGCACVLALVVEGPAGRLADLLASPQVRGVELAPRGAQLPGLEIRPLAPETTGEVPDGTGSGG